MFGTVCGFGAGCHEQGRERTETLTNMKKTE